MKDEAIYLIAIMCILSSATISWAVTNDSIRRDINYHCETYGKYATDKFKLTCEKQK